MINHVFIFLELRKVNMVNTIFKKYLNLTLMDIRFYNLIFPKKKM